MPQIEMLIDITSKEVSLEFKLPVILVQRGYQDCNYVFIISFRVSEPAKEFFVK